VQNLPGMCKIEILALFAMYNLTEHIIVIQDENGCESQSGTGLNNIFHSMIV
jgi:hypothetical protein